jgi:hypothetical protein
MQCTFFLPSIKALSLLNHHSFSISLLLKLISFPLYWISFISLISIETFSFFPFCYSASESTCSLSPLSKLSLSP